MARGSRKAYGIAYVGIIPDSVKNSSQFKQTIERLFRASVRRKRKLSILYKKYYTVTTLPTRAVVLVTIKRFPPKVIFMGPFNQLIGSNGYVRFKSTDKFDTFHEESTSLSRNLHDIPIKDGLYYETNREGENPLWAETTYINRVITHTGAWLNKSAMVLYADLVAHTSCPCIGGVSQTIIPNITIKDHYHLFAQYFANSARPMGFWTEGVTRFPDPNGEAGFPLLTMRTREDYLWFYSDTAVQTRRRLGSS